jgi:hypothetical protein
VFFISVFRVHTSINLHYRREFLVNNTLQMFLFIFHEQSAERFPGHQLPALQCGIIMLMNSRFSSIGSAYICHHFGLIIHNLSCSATCQTVVGQLVDVLN